MSEFPARLVEIGRSFEQTYKPVLGFGGWKVAMLRHCEDVDVTNFQRIERHQNTNEVFILTAGHTDLIVFDGDDVPSACYVASMEINVAYNVERSVWHQVVMAQDAHIVIFEREETSIETTDYKYLDADTIKNIKASLEQP